MRKAKPRRRSPAALALADAVFRQRKVASRKRYSRKRQPKPTTEV